MKCLYCESEYGGGDLYSLLIEKDSLCQKCRQQLRVKYDVFYLDGMRITSFYDYDSLFKTLILQYKECYDEALYPVFLYRLTDFIKFRYRKYHVVFAPSTMAKRKLRGFDHLRKIFEELGFKEAGHIYQKKELVQEGKDSAERALMRDNFIYDGPFYEKILIIDDVMTTGSTLMGIHRAIGDKASTVDALVLAKVFMLK